MGHGEGEIIGVDDILPVVSVAARDFLAGTAQEPQHAVTDEAQLEILGTAEQAPGEVVGDHIDVGGYAHEFFAPFLNLGEEEIDAFSE